MLMPETVVIQPCLQLHPDNQMTLVLSRQSCDLFGGLLEPDCTWENTVGRCPLLLLVLQ